MSNLWLNVRFGRWHLQGARDWPWIALRYNHHWDYRTAGARLGSSGCYD